MKKLTLLSSVILFFFIFHINVSADEDGLAIEGLDHLVTEYEAGTNPDTIDFTEGLRLYENSDILAPEKLLVEYNPDDFNRIGPTTITYYVLFTVDGENLRFNIDTLDIMIVDHEVPKLHGTHTIYVRQNQNAPIDYLSGVTAADNDVSSPLNIMVFSQGVDLTKTGLYPFSYYVVDKSGNGTKKTEYVVVQNETVDNNEPVIHVSTDAFNLQTNIDNPEAIYMDEVSAMDGTEDITDYVIYDDSGVDYTQVGSYHVVFVVIDRDGHEAVSVIPVNIVEDYEAPYFEGLGNTKDITINTSSLKEDVKAYDDVCGDVTDRIIVELNEFDFSKQGYYDVIYKVTDLNGNETVKNVKLHVYDNLAPTITLPEDDIYFLDLNQPLNLNKVVKVADNYDQHVTYTIDENNLDITKEGLYVIDITAKDASGNVSTKKLSISVSDNMTKEFYENPFFVGALVAVVISGVITSIGYSINKKKRGRRRYYTM